MARVRLLPMLRRDRPAGVRTLTIEVRRRIDGATAIWLLTAGLLVTALLGWLLHLQGLPALDAPLHVPTWALAVGFAFAEMRPVHIQLRRDSHSFSLSEIPLVAGLFFATPTGLMLAQLVGLGAALGLHRRQPSQKLLFNVAHWSLGAVAALTVFRVVLGHAEPVAPLGWLAAALGALASSSVSTLAIFAAISLSEGSFSLRRLREIGLFSGIGTLTNASLALVAVVTAWRDPWSALLLLVPTGTIYLAYRAYTSQREQHQTLEFLYESSRALHESQGVESAIGGLLVQARDTFRAEVAELVLAPPRPGEPGLRMRLAGDARGEALEPVAFTPCDSEALDELGHRGPILVRPGAVESDAIQTYLDTHALGPDVLLAPLAGETRPLGVLVLAERLGDVSFFDREDLRLFATLANHVSSSLEVGRLEKTLDQLTALKDELRHRAYHDQLTGLANRTLFADEVDQAVIDARDTSAVLFFDLDDFKLVNDSLGHGAGDELLVAVARRVQASLKETDLAARLGGDEFAVLLRDVDSPEQAEQVAGRIIAAMELPFTVGGGHSVVTHLSVGIALPDDTVAEGGDLLRNADVAMYAAKRDGKGSFRRFHPAMHDAAAQRLSRRGELLLALNNDEFEVFLQPLVDLADRAPIGAEALLRWRHPTEGLIGPGEFLEVAEASGLILPIGSWVLEEACVLAAAWTEPLTISVNISPSQLQRGDIVADVRRALDRSRLAPERLLVEVTETEIMRDFETSRGTLRELSDLGVHLALDDFGTGYSSMAYLAQLPFDVLKIAKTFVDGIGTDGSGSTVARAILELAGSLGLRTIAEGIEHEHQAEVLTAWGCDVGQGYLFGRPVEAASSEVAVIGTAGV